MTTYKPYKTQSPAEEKYRSWWRNATPIERVQLEIMILDYHIKVAKLQALGERTPEKSYVYKVENMEERWNSPKPIPQGSSTNHKKAKTPD